MKPIRHFVPTDFKVTTWAALEPLFDDLLARELDNAKALEKLLLDRSELEAVLEEDFAWRYIGSRSDTENKEKQARYEDFVENIQPKLAPLSDQLNRKIYESNFFSELPDDLYGIYKRSLQASIEIFREKNIPVFTELSKLATEFNQISGRQTIELAGKTLTMEQASNELKSTDRDHREKAYRLMVDRRAADYEDLDKLLDKLINRRGDLAKNADYANFRDYQFAALERFDYTPEDCEKFYASVRDAIVPVVRKIQQDRADKMGLKKLKPWDMAVNPAGLAPLRPFTNAQELIDKTTACFAAIKPVYGEYIRTMEKMGHFDLESRTGKGPGGFMYPLYECGVPFIFMNSVGSQRDLETIVHEGGHAIHSFLAHDLPLNEFKDTPSEVAELASMAMEMISMPFWDHFYDDPADLKRAQQEKLQDALLTLPWVVMVDQFQHWLYLHPGHTAEERVARWQEILSDFDTGMIDYSGFETAQGRRWQAQLHIYTVPFYYIEYGFAQLGAMALWRNFCSDQSQALSGYEAFMKLGYTRTIPEIYQAAGVEFRFDADYVGELIDFVGQQLD